jgi:putative RecB family exonuclease
MKNNNQYSPSKINTFNECKLRYKYRYIDGLVSDVETIERFLGSVVHEALEEFYKLVKGGNVESLDWLLKKYEELWQKNFTDSIKIVKDGLEVKNYFDNGKRYLKDYYNKYKPFNQAKVVDTERLIDFDVELNEAKYLFRGILDRLDWNDKENIFEIHDYKTGGKLITQEEADNDWQLGLYHVAIKKRWPSDIDKIKLVWHFLAMNKEITSFRTKAQIDELQRVVVAKIKEIESCNDFSPRNKSAICDWCDFQNICPLWKHPKEMEKLDINHYKKDPGVKLVTEYKKLEEAKSEHKEEIHKIEEEQEKIKEAAIEFAEKEKVLIIDGPDARLKIDIKEELRAPTRTEDKEKWENLREILKKEGKYEEVSTVNNNMINYRLKQWPKELMEKIANFLIKTRSEKVKLVKK